jgi:predicted homoserine dehydrogenase-like protein
MPLGERDAAELVALRSALAAALPQRAVPDLCELQVVANATGLVPDRPTLHAPIAHVTEVPSLLCLHGDGGLLGGTNRLDVFHCLRAPHETSFGGGVFVVVRCDDAASWRMLEEKGHVLGRRGSTAMIGLPRHLLGLEAATSVIGAALGQSTGGIAPHPRLDLVARASEDLPSGTLLTAGGHHHTIAGLTGELQPAAPLAGAAPVPFYLVADRRLVRPVRAGQYVALDDLAIEPDSTLLALRLRQDRRFFAAQAGSPSGIA